MEASGEVTVEPTMSSSLKLDAVWSKGQVDLKWDRPQFESASFKLDGYVVSSMNYGPSNTAASKNLIEVLPPNRMEWAGRLEQTYRWNTQGDVQGYVVDAILHQHTSTGTIQTIRIGAMAQVPLPPAV